MQPIPRPTYLALRGDLAAPRRAIWGRNKWWIGGLGADAPAGMGPQPDVVHRAGSMAPG
ncbi:MAG: hypothetical protein ACLU5I_09385 [Alistipes finegoldii]